MKVDTKHNCTGIHNNKKNHNLFHTINNVISLDLLESP